MGSSWSALRRELENEYLCKSLQGRVQYFLTNYHKAPDNYGRVAVRVDGKEVLMGNPYDYYVKGYSYQEDKLKDMANPLVRMLAIMDRRIGKRTLLKLKSEIQKQPEWLQFFYKLRFESEKLL